MRLPSRSVVSLTAAALVVLAAVAVGPAAADARLTLTDATVAPSTPTAGAPVTVTTTVRLSGGSDTPLTLDEVVVEDAGGETVGRAADLGRLSPGETLEVPVTFTVEEPGTHDLQVVASGRDGDGRETSAVRPLTVGVERGEPLVELRTDGLVGGAETSVQAVVSNPTTAPLRDVEVRVVDPAAGDRLRRTVPVIPAGGATTLNFSVRAPGGPSAGSAETANLTVRTTYTDPTGTVSRADFARRVPVDPLRDRVAVRVGRPAADDGDQVPGGIASVVGGDGESALGGDGEEPAAGSSVAVTVANAGNAPVEEVVLAAETLDGTALSAVGRFPVGRLAPGESTTVQVDLGAAATAGVEAVRFVAAYDLGGERRRSAVAYRELRTAGNATLTGLDVGVDGDRVTVEGNLANTGNGEITGAVVAVRSTEFVRPAYPRRSYFVGTVGGSEFAPFNLTARADVANATAVSVEVTYVAGGERVSDAVAVPLPEDGSTSARAGALPGVLPLALGGVLLGGLGAAVVCRRRRG